MGLGTSAACRHFSQDNASKTFKTPYRSHWRDPVSWQWLACFSRHVRRAFPICFLSKAVDKRNHRIRVPTAIADPGSSAIGLTVSLAPITSVTSVSLKSSFISSISSTTEKLHSITSVSTNEQLTHYHRALMLPREEHYIVLACDLQLDGWRTLSYIYKTIFSNLFETRTHSNIDAFGS